MSRPEGGGGMQGLHWLVHNYKFWNIIYFWNIIARVPMCDVTNIFFRISKLHYHCQKVLEKIWIMVKIWCKLRKRRLRYDPLNIQMKVKLQRMFGDFSSFNCSYLSEFLLDFWKFFLNINMMRFKKIIKNSFVTSSLWYSIVCFCCLSIVGSASIVFAVIIKKKVVNAEVRAVILVNFHEWHSMYQNIFIIILF